MSLSDDGTFGNEQVTEASLPVPLPVGRHMTVVALGNMVPLAAAILSAPLLARSLGLVGRGDVAAATAPLFLAMYVGTVGLPQAVSYYIARDPVRSKTYAKVAMGLLIVPAILSTAGCLALVPVLTGGDHKLAFLMVVSTCALPVVLGVTMLRATAAGHQQWNYVAAEQVVSALVRIVPMVVLFVFSRLTPLEATVITASAPYAGGVVYLGARRQVRRVTRGGHRRPQPRPRSTPGRRPSPRLAGGAAPVRRPVPAHSLGSASSPALRPVPARVAGERTSKLNLFKPSTDAESGKRDAGKMLRYGLRIWIGAISGVLLLRLDQLIMTPLSSARQLGLYAVAANFSEVALVVNNAVRDVTFVTGAASFSMARVCRSARASGTVSTALALLIAAGIPFVIPTVFGSEFRGAVSVALILLAAVALGTPGSVAGAALSSLGRPGLRSLSLVFGSIVNAIVLVPFVIKWGAQGAAWATLIGNVIASNGNIIMLSRMTDTRLRDFYALRRADLSSFKIFRPARSQNSEAAV